MLDLHEQGDVPLVVDSENVPLVCVKDVIAWREKIARSGSEDEEVETGRKEVEQAQPYVRPLYEDDDEGDDDSDREDGEKDPATSFKVGTQLREGRMKSSKVAPSAVKAADSERVNRPPVVGAKGTRTKVSNVATRTTAHPGPSESSRLPGMPTLPKPGPMPGRSKSLKSLAALPKPAGKAGPSRKADLPAVNAGASRETTHL